MLRLAIVYLVVALIAAFFGSQEWQPFPGERAKILFVVFLIPAVLSFLGYGFRRRTFWEWSTCDLTETVNTTTEPGSTGTQSGRRKKTAKWCWHHRFLAANHQPRRHALQ